MFALKELVFVGLGLNDEKGISLNGLEEAKTADSVFIELYTSLMPELSLKNLETLTGKHIHILNRQNLEEENGKLLTDAAKKGKTVFFIPGDPFIATTHTTLRIEAAKQNIPTRIIHGASIISAIVSLSGLHSYTVPFPENYSDTPYNVITQNKQRGLHTICLLDIQQTENRYLTINQALTLLTQTEQKKQLQTATEDTIALGIARAGNKTPTLKADTIHNLQQFDFGPPPQTLIIPGQLHFTETEALIALANAPQTLRSTTP